MDIRFSLEDDNDVDIVIDGDSIQIDIDNPIQKEVEDGIDAIENILSVINTLNTTRTHIQKFGITKEFLHLTNANNNLGSAIGMSLPYYESDNANLDQITEDELPDVDIVVETMEEALTKAKDKLLAVLKWFKDKWSQFWNWLLGSEKQKDAKVKEASQKVETVKQASNNATSEEIKEKAKEVNIKGYNYNDILKAVEKGKKAIEALNYLSVDKNTGDAKASGLEHINAFIVELEYSLDDEKNLSVNTTSGSFLPEKEESNLDALGWDDKNIRSIYELGEVNLKVGSFNMSNKSSLTDMLDKAISDLQKGKTDLDLKQTNPEIFNIIKKIKDNLAVILSATKETAECRRILLNYIVIVCSQFAHCCEVLLKDE